MVFILELKKEKVFLGYNIVKLICLKTENQYFCVPFNLIPNPFP